MSWRTGSRTDGADPENGLMRFKIDENLPDALVGAWDVQSSHIGATMPASQAFDLETEIRYFNERRSELLKEAAGRFALVKGEALIGTFDSETEAIRHAYRTLGNVPFLVKQVTEADIPLSFTSFNLGV